MSFLDINVISEQSKFTSIYQKPTFSGVYTHLIAIFLTPTKLIYTLINRCFWICSNWSMPHSQLTLLGETFQKNDYPKNFIDKCFKLFLNRIHILKENFRTVEKKPLRLVLLQTRTKL